MLIRMVVFAAAVAFAAMNAIAFSVVDVRAQQRFPWNGKVDVEFELLTGDAPEESGSEGNENGSESNETGNAGQENGGAGNGTGNAEQGTAGEEFGADTNQQYVVSIEFRNIIDEATTNLLAAKTFRLKDEGEAKSEFILPAGRHIITWDADADAPALLSTNIFVNVVVKREKAVDEAEYMVIDVSGGTGAASYPISMLDCPPAGGWTEEYKTTKIVLRKCPKGDDPGKRYRLTKDFYAGVFEITQRQWELVMGNNPVGSSAYGKSGDRPVYNVSYGAIRGTNLGTKWPDNAEVDEGSFIHRLRNKTGLSTFDLPTEAQWEYACQAGSNATDNTGSNDELPGWYADNNGANGMTGTKPVGLLATNVWGLCDMRGNVWELCLDRWKAGAELKGDDPPGAMFGNYRVAKGGCWNSSADLCTSSSRLECPMTTTSPYLGFRLFRTSGEESKPKEWDADGSCWEVETGECARMTLDTRTVKEVSSGSVNIPYAIPKGESNVVVTVNGDAILSATNSGVFVWNSLTNGTYEISLAAGEDPILVNVTSANRPPAMPARPAESQDPGMTISHSEREFGHEGGGFAIRTEDTDGTETKWTAEVKSADWITIGGSASGTAGKSTLRYNVAANPCAEARTGYILIGGIVHTVKQRGAPVSMPVKWAEFGKDGGTGEFVVEAAEGVKWNAFSDVDWISISEVTGSGTGTVKYAVAPWHEDTPRNPLLGRIRIGGVCEEATGKFIEGVGECFNVEQHWKVFGFGPPESRFVGLGKDTLRCSSLQETNRVEVSALPGYDWGVEYISHPEWVKVIEEGTMSGDGTLVLEIETNNVYEARSGIVRIHGAELLVEQAGWITLDTSGVAFGPEYGEYTVRVMAHTNSPWKAVSSDPWSIGLDAGEGSELGYDYAVEGKGPGTFVVYVFDIEDSVDIVNGWITVGDAMMFVKQKRNSDEYDLPDLGADADRIDIGMELADSADTNLMANVTNAMGYAAFRNWAEAAGLKPKDVKTSAFTWLSYHVLGIDRLLGNPGLKMFAINKAEYGYCETGIGIGEITDAGWEEIILGSGANAEELKNFVRIEGAPVMKIDEFSSTNVLGTTFGAEGGKVKVRFRPRNSDARSFFLRAILRP